MFRRNHFGIHITLLTAANKRESITSNKNFKIPAWKFLLIFLLLLFFKIPALGEQRITNSVSYSDNFLASWNHLDNQSSEESTDDSSRFGVCLKLLFGLGHHDNLTEANSWTGQTVQTKEVYWTIHLNPGFTYRKFSLSLFLAGTVPVPRTNRADGYSHRGEFDDKGLILRARLFQLKSRINLVPQVGYKWLTETARIYDPQSNDQDILNTRYSDNGLMFGTEFSIVFSKKGEKDKRVALTYTHENFKRAVNRYRIEWRNVDHTLINPERKQGREGAAYWSLGAEIVTRSDGRSDWFFIISVSGEITGK